MHLACSPTHLACNPTHLALRTQAASIRVGPFAVDQSYWQFYLGFEGANLSLSYTGGNGTLHILATPQGNPILLTLTLTLALTLTRHAAHTGGAAGLCPRRWLRVRVRWTPPLLRWLPALFRRQLLGLRTRCGAALPLVPWGRRRGGRGLRCRHALAKGPRHSHCRLANALADGGAAATRAARRGAARRLQPRWWQAAGAARGRRGRAKPRCGAHRGARRARHRASAVRGVRRACRGQGGAAGGDYVELHLHARRVRAVPTRLARVELRQRERQPGLGLRDLRLGQHLRLVYDLARPARQGHRLLQLHPGHSLQDVPGDGAQLLGWWQ